MSIAHGTFNGTGAAVVICCGFVPDWVKVWAVEDAELAQVEWNKNFRAAESVEGFLNHGGDQTFGLYTAGTGIRPYYGGVQLTTTLQTSTTYGEGVYLAREDKSYHYNEDTGLNINAWTLQTSGSRSGKLNAGVQTTYVGEGSRINIAGIWYVIESVSNDGDDDDEVVLNYAAPTGEVLAISGMYDYVPALVGTVTRAGFVLSATADINVNNEIQAFAAGTWD